MIHITDTKTNRTAEIAGCTNNANKIAAAYNIIDQILLALVFAIAFDSFVCSVYVRHISLLSNVNASPQRISSAPYTATVTFSKLFIPIHPVVKGVSDNQK